MALIVNAYNEGGGVWTINAKTGKQIVCELRGPAQTLPKLNILYTTSHSVKIIPTEDFNYQVDAIINDGGPIACTVRIGNNAVTPDHPKFEATVVSIKDHSALIDVNFEGEWTIPNTEATSNLIIESNGNSINISSPDGEDITGRVINIVDSTGEVHAITL